MDRKDWYDFGSQIGDLVQSAIDNNDYKKLNESIVKTLNDTLDSVQRGMGIGGAPRNPGRSYGEYRHTGNAYRDALNKANQSRRSAKPQTDMGSIAASVLGITMSSLFGVSALVMGILSLAIGFPVFAPLTIFFIGMAVMSGKLGSRGSKTKRAVKAMNRYLKIMGERNTVTIAELASGTGQSEKKVLKELKELISQGVFADAAYLDAEETCLMIGHDAYRQYQETMQAARRRSQEEKAKEQNRRQAEKNMASMNEETKQILQEGKDFIQHIHYCNEQIPDVEMTEKLSKLEQIVSRIFEQVAAKPDSAPDLHKMMSYYLPITRKLVDAYKELDHQNIGGENISKTKREIELSLDTINGAFETFLDGFFEDTAWDISSDISTLKTMMARDGLTGANDFKPGSHTSSVSSDFNTGTAAAGSAGAAYRSAKGAGAAAAYQEEE